MAYHNPTCGCAECRNYGQRYNPGAIHNQSCGCSACGNYGTAKVDYSSSAAPNYLPPQTHASASAAIDFLSTCEVASGKFQPESLAESIAVLTTAIDASAASVEQKQETKTLLDELMTRPLATEALNELVELLRKLLDKAKSAT